MKELQDRILKDGQVIGTNILKAVSYTHLDVYKRQAPDTCDFFEN